MNNVVMLFTVYFLAANLVAGVIYIFGREKAGLLRVEYPFIYAPWLAMMILFDDFSNLPGLAESGISLKYFLMLVQGFSCGILGGAVLLPRFFIRSQGVIDKLRITLLSSLAVSILFLISRFLLLEMIRWALSMRG